jgi:signal transduction histidine kinase
LSECKRLIKTVDRLEKTVNEITSKYNDLRDFVSIGAHEIRAPLMPILGISELLESELGEMGKEEASISKNQIETIIRNTQKLAKISSEILDVTKIESKLLILRKTDFDLNELVIKTVNDFRRVASKKNVQIKYQQQLIKIDRSTLEVDEETENPTKLFVFADMGRIAQVISNLLDNAIRYTEDGGTITVDMTTKACNTNGKNDHNQFDSIITITDSGPGINSTLLTGNRLFSKFCSNEPSGTGLGLYISKKIVEAHDGTIWAQNNPDRHGASFTFALPLTLSC